MIRYYITDSTALGGEAALLKNIERLADTIDYLQIREKDLEGRRLAALTRAILKVVHPSVRVLVNDRADVALASGAHGVHLRSNAISPRRLRRILPPDFQISVSCHGVESVRAAGAEGADLALLAPIFETPGKGSALGLPVLAEAARFSGIPVIALGGITLGRIAPSIEAGAAGIAAIRMFQESSF